jgi:hypothetical protein
MKYSNYSNSDSELTKCAIPTGLTLSIITGGVKIDWTDSSAGADQTEIWGRNDSDAYDVNPLYTINAGTVTKSETIAPVDLRYYKIRAKNGTNYSDFTAEVSIAMLGAELVTDPYFANGALWTPTANWSLSNGVWTHSSATNDNVYLKTPPNVNVIGRKYRIKVTVGVSVLYRAQVDNTSGWYTSAGVGTSSYVATCGSVSEYYSLRGANNVTVSYFSIKAVVGT